MNPLKTFESRVRDIFGQTPQGLAVPFSFKKLAKLAARGMENETYEINGVDTAPALYNVFVSPADFANMKPLYARLANEICAFVEDQAHAKGYVFVGKPIARFMPESDIRSGKFQLVAENVDARTLEEIRREESQFSGVSAGRMQPIQAPAPAPRQQAVPAPAPAPAPEAAPVPDIPRTTRRPLVADALPGEFAPEIDPGIADPSAGLRVIPADFVDSVAPGAAVAAAAVEPAVPEPAPAPAPAPEPAPAHVARHSHKAEPQPQASAPAEPATCLLIDHQSGRAYRAVAPRTQIGRERAAGAIVLRDPNVSRKHAELTFDGRDWHIRDTGSTNGTLVNDIDVDECTLRDGDLLTLGLLNLEFRRN